MIIKSWNNEYFLIRIENSFNNVAIPNNISNIIINTIKLPTRPKFLIHYVILTVFSNLLPFLFLHKPVKPRVRDSIRAQHNKSNKNKQLRKRPLSEFFSRNS